MATTTTAPTRRKRKPIRGILYGVFFGLGLALIAIGQGWAALGTYPPVILLVVGIVIGFVWSTFGPAKKPKGPPPAVAAEPEPPSEPPVDEPAHDEPGDILDVPADELTADAADAPDDNGDEATTDPT